jgi:hypothetical protein
MSAFLQVMVTMQTSIISWVLEVVGSLHGMMALFKILMHAEIQIMQMQVNGLQTFYTNTLLEASGVMSSLFFCVARFKVKGTLIVSYLKMP